jgi:D-alanyl-D-alanine carboxypeptidase
MSYTVVVMGCERKFNKDKSWVVEYYGNYEEAWNLLQFSFEKYKICRLLHDGYALKQFTVAGGENEVVAQSHTNLDAILPAEAHQRQLIFKYSVQGGGLTAPIAYDQKVGTLQIYYRTSCVAETELFAMSSVRALDELDLDIQGAASRDDSNLSGFLTFLGIACLIILLPLVAYVMINNVRRIIVRGRRRRRRKSRRRSRGL